VFAQATGGGLISLPRSDLAAAILSSLDGNVEMVFGDSIGRIDQTDAGV